MTDELRVALLQLMPGSSIGENRERGRDACRKARLAGADIALFPEMWSVGYSIPPSREELGAAAIGRDDAFVGSFAALAKELGMAIAITYLEKTGGMPRNSVTLFDRFGREAFTYAKVHTCDFGEEANLAPGDGFFVSELYAECGPVKVGAMICYDREFPESARILMLKGAELILVPNACPMEINRISQLRGRAYENMLAIATANYPKGQPDCNGHSTAFDGIAYPHDGTGSRDTLVVEAGEAEGICVAKFNLAALRDYRKREVHGNAYRHPEKYALLVSPEIAEPFVRADRRP